jgi:hypothetical protein
MATKKDPLAPVSLKGKEAEWFVDYLEGNVEVDPEIEKKRKQLLREAEAQEIQNPDEICLKI